MQIDSTVQISRHHMRNRLMTERRQQRVRKERVRLERMPEETAQEYIEHYERHGIEHFKPDHCPEKFRAAVVAHFGRAA